MKEIKSKKEFLALFNEVKESHPRAYIGYREEDNITKPTEFVHSIMTCPYTGKNEEQPQKIATFKAKKRGFIFN